MGWTLPYVQAFVPPVNPGTLASDPFPRLRWQVIAPNAGGGYQLSTFQTNAGLFNIVDFGPYMGIEQFMGQNFKTIFQNVKANGTANGITTRCLHYTNSANQAENNSGSGVGTNGATYTVWTSALNNANGGSGGWWLRAAPFPSGGIVTDSFGDGGVMNRGSQNTLLDSGGRTFSQGYWNHYDGVLRQGNAVSQGYASNVAFATNSLVDGYQMDNVFVTNREAGAWQNNSTNFGTQNASVTSWLQQGNAAQIAALKALNPSLLVMCNADYFLNTNGFGINLAPANVDASIKGKIDMVYCQVCIGPNGLEGFTSTTTQFLQGMINAEVLMATTGTLVFEQSGASASAWSNTTSQSSWTAADWQAARFGMACACMRNWHYNITFSTNSYGPNQICLMDEFQQRGVRPWLGAPQDPVQTASRVQGVWYRVFQNGVVFMNPVGNGSQTINLSSIGLNGYSAIASQTTIGAQTQAGGFGVNTLNTGNPVTSITIAARDGRFLIPT